MYYYSCSSPIQYNFGTVLLENLYLSSFQQTAEALLLARRTPRNCFRILLCPRQPRPLLMFAVRMALCIVIYLFILNPLCHRLTVGP